MFDHEEEACNTMVTISANDDYSSVISLLQAHAGVLDRRMEIFYLCNYFNLIN